MTSTPDAPPLNAARHSPAQEAKEVECAMLSLLSPLADRVHTITSDNGSEFARHTPLSTSLNALFFFAHPYASWERGLNENTQITPLSTLDIPPRGWIIDPWADRNTEKSPTCVVSGSLVANGFHPSRSLRTNQRLQRAADCRR